MSLLGEITPERAYYHCGACHRGHCLGDAVLRLDASDLTPGAQRAVALAGVLSGFADAATKTLPELAGLRLSESTVERATERAGERLGRRLAEGDTLGPASDWDWGKDADGKTVAYVSADLTGVGMQGEGGKSAEGRMAAVAMIYDIGSKGRVRYLAGMTGGLAALGEPLRRQGAQVGMDRAERWVAISDGGSGLEGWLRGNFPRVEAVILDFYHAAEHLNDWAKAMHPGDPESAARMAGAWCSWLKREGGEVLLGALEGLTASVRGAAAEAHRELLTYFRNQRHRMDYPEYRRKGWRIGSGPVESACKQVGERLKGSGMRWSEAGADAVLHLRAAFKSQKGQWDAVWATAA